MRFPIEKGLSEKTKKHPVKGFQISFFFYLEDGDCHCRVVSISADFVPLGKGTVIAFADVEWSSGPKSPGGSHEGPDKAAEGFAFLFTSRMKRMFPSTIVSETYRSFFVNKVCSSDQGGGRGDIRNAFSGERMPRAGMTGIFHLEFIPGVLPGSEAARREVWIYLYGDHHVPKNGGAGGRETNLSVRK